MYNVVYKKSIVIHNSKFSTWPIFKSFGLNEGQDIVVEVDGKYFH